MSDLTSFQSTWKTMIPLTLNLYLIFFQKHSDFADIRSWYQDHKVKCIQYQENCCKGDWSEEYITKEKNSFFFNTLLKYRMLFKRNLFQVQLTKKSQIGYQDLTLIYFFFIQLYLNTILFYLYLSEIFVYFSKLHLYTNSVTSVFRFFKLAADGDFFWTFCTAFSILVVMLLT